MQLTLSPECLTAADFRTLMRGTVKTLELDATCFPAIAAASQAIGHILAAGTPVYGINTGFGALAGTRIPAENLSALQHCLVLSHAAGTGELLPESIVRLVLILKIHSLARGYSGVRPEILTGLIQLFNHAVWPCIPAQGSVGASGDLSPLAHLAAVLLGEGQVQHAGRCISAREGLKIAGLTPFTLGPKEGLALLNGTQVSTAIALYAYFTAENLFLNALITGALSVEAALGSHVPFDARIQTVRGHKTQATVARLLRHLLADSPLQRSHIDCERVQDPYSLRCQPQVMGACLAHLQFVRDILLTEAHAVSDNPLVFAEDKVILSGGNFHAEPVAMAADTLALAIAETGSLSERRTALLIDTHFSGLPPFLAKDPGMQSGFMSVQVTAAALASENKGLAHPASIDSLPTSANQEDHVSMATHAARRLLSMNKNLEGILAIELLAACQGLDFRRPLKTSLQLEKVFAHTRTKISFYEDDRCFAPDIVLAREIIQQGILPTITELSLDHEKEK